jgi:hypothetical protein
MCLATCCLAVVAHVTVYIFMFDLVSICTHIHGLHVGEPTVRLILVRIGLFCITSKFNFRPLSAEWFLRRQGRHSMPFMRPERLLPCHKNPQWTLFWAIWTPSGFSKFCSLFFSRKHLTIRYTDRINISFCLEVFDMVNIQHNTKKEHLLTTPCE